MKVNWNQPSILKPLIYECGWCKKEVTSVNGYFATITNSHGQLHIRICNCGLPTFFDTEGRQTPGKLLGRKIEKLPPNIKEIYTEIQKASSSGSYTLVILGCRKLLMHIAVKQGASEGLKFIEYVKWFEDKGHAPPKATKWISKIKDKGNEANHEVKLYKEEDAAEILKLCEMLLTFLYEYGDEEESTAA